MLCWSLTPGSTEGPRRAKIGKFESVHQENAAADQWFSHLCAVLERLKFEASKGISSVLRRKVRPVAVSVHVDDKLVAGNKGQSKGWMNSRRSSS